MRWKQVEDEPKTFALILQPRAGRKWIRVAMSPS